MSKQHLVAVIGAGPAGIYGTRKLTEAGHRVLLINRDIKPGGLAEYGIFLDKEKMKTGLRKQFHRILADPKVSYLGHVTVGEGKSLTLKDLQEIGFSAIVVSAGAQGTKGCSTTKISLRSRSLPVAVRGKRPTMTASSKSSKSTSTTTICGKRLSASGRILKRRGRTSMKSLTSSLDRRLRRRTKDCVSDTCVHLPKWLATAMEKLPAWKLS